MKRILLIFVVLCLAAGDAAAVGQGLGQCAWPTCSSGSGASNLIELDDVTAKQGNSQEVQMADGATVTGNVTVYDANGNLIDGGQAPGGAPATLGLVGDVTITAPADFEILLRDESGTTDWINVLMGGDASIAVDGTVSVAINHSGTSHHTLFDPDDDPNVDHLNVCTTDDPNTFASSGTQVFNDPVDILPDATNGVRVTAAGLLAKVGTGSIQCDDFSVAADLDADGTLSSNAIDALAQLNPNLCLAGKVLERQGSIWACIDTPAGGFTPDPDPNVDHDNVAVINAGNSFASGANQSFDDPIQLESGNDLIFEDADGTNTVAFGTEDRTTNIVLSWNVAAINACSVLGNSGKLTINSSGLIICLADISTGGGNVDLLDGTVHQDTVAVAAADGAIIIGNVSNLWDRLVAGTADQYLTMGAARPEWAGLNLLDADNQGTVAQVLHGNVAGAVSFGPVADADISFTTPALGTPSAAVMTNASGTAASLTCGNVTTNANLTGPVTSIGNATTVGAGVIAETMMSTEDFGDFSCGAGAIDCDLNGGVVNEDELAAIITLAASDEFDAGLAFLEIPNAASPVVSGEDGRIALDTTDDQLIIRSITDIVIPTFLHKCVGIEDLVSGDEVGVWMPDTAVDIQEGWCTCLGPNCGTPATLVFSDDVAGNDAAGTMTCADAPVIATKQTITGFSTFAAREAFLIDVTNSPTADGDYIVCWNYTVDRT